MITDTQDIQVITNLKGKKIDLTFDENSLAHIMSVLTDLYSDPELAIIREYSTNAWDSHVAAGVDRPIEVTYPTPLSQYFKVRDYGLGLSLQEIEDIYSKYGASTKRDTNDMVGMLGLGCKSALTCSNQFTMIAVKDGKLTKAIISRDETGAGGINILEHYDTDESNGVEIIVPTNRDKSHIFQYKIADFFAFWPSGRVLINGVLNKFIEGTWIIKDKLYIVNRKSLKSFSYNYGSKLQNGCVYMGGVPYPHDFSSLGIKDNGVLVAFVDIGEVNFTPSRESLHYTKKTTNTIDKITNLFNVEILKTVQKEIDGTNTRIEALKIKEKWEKIYPSALKKHTLEWRGDEIPKDNISFPNPVLTTNTDSYRKTDIYNIDYISITSDSLYQTVVVCDYNIANFTATIKNKLIAWANQYYNFNYNVNFYRGVRFLFFPTKEKPLWIKKNPWLNEFKVISYEEDIKPIKLTPSKVQKNIKGSFKGIKDGVFRPEIDLDDVEPSTNIYYAEGRLEVLDNSTQKILEELNNNKKYVVVYVPSNRLNKFLRNNPTAVSVSTGVKNFFKEVESSLTDEVKEAFVIMQMSRYGKEVKLLDPQRVDDPILKRQIRLATMDLSKSKSVLSRIWNHNRDLFPRIELRINKYVLFDSKLLLHYPDHIYNYLNASYKKGV